MIRGMLSGILFLLVGTSVAHAQWYGPDPHSQRYETLAFIQQQQVQTLRANYAEEQAAMEHALAVLAVRYKDRDDCELRLKRARQARERDLARKYGKAWNNLQALHAAQVRQLMRTDSYSYWNNPLPGRSNRGACTPRGIFIR